MLEQALLRKQFETLLADQQAVLGQYESAGARHCDPEARVHFEVLCRDKKRHILLTQRLLEIVE